MNWRRSAAINRSQIARQAKPLGELIHRMREAKTAGKDPFDVMPPPPMPKAHKRALKAHKETTLVRECLQWLVAHGIFAWRNNSGTLWVGERPISYGYPGSGDILGILPGGQFLSVECKSEKGKQSDTQKQFQEKIKQCGAIYLLVRSITELEEQINDCW